MLYEPCRYLRYKELFSGELVSLDEENPPAVAYAWCNLTLKEIGRDDCPVSMTACSRPGRTCYRGIQALALDPSKPSKNG
jgi:hypothetical protein